MDPNDDFLPGLGGIAPLAMPFCDEYWAFVICCVSQDELVICVRSPKVTYPVPKKCILVMPSNTLVFYNNN